VSGWWNTNNNKYDCREIMGRFWAMYTTKWQHLCKISGGSCLLQARSIVLWSLIKHKYRSRKRQADVASNIHSHQHLMGPAPSRPGDAENGVPSPHIFHFNHMLSQLWKDRRVKNSPICPVTLFKETKPSTPRLRSRAIFLSQDFSNWARFTKYLTTILRLSYDNAKVTIDLR